MLHYRCFHKSFVDFRIYSQLTLVISVAASRNLRLYLWTSTFSCSLWFLRLLIRFLISRLIGPKKHKTSLWKLSLLTAFPFLHRSEMHIGLNYTTEQITVTILLSQQCWHVSINLQWLLFKCAFSALTLLTGHQEEHLACTNWCGYLSWVRWNCLHIVQLMPLLPKPYHLLPLFNPGWFYLSGLPRLSGKEAVIQV